MASYYDDPEFYKSAFTKLVGALQSSGALSEDKAEEYIDLMIGDGGVGVPFDVMVSDLLAMGPPKLTAEEYSLLTLLGETIWAEEYLELIEALNTSPEHTPSSGLIHS